MAADDASAIAESGPGTKPKVFVSYARRDAAFVDRLEAALAARGVEALVDRTEIYAFEDWWKRIETLIAQADTVVFVLSPDAVRADSVCQTEVAFAQSLNKRFAPVLCRRVDDAAVPEPLRRLNWVFFDDDARFESGADRLAEALATDIAWIRQHTEFGAAARRWAAAGRPRGLLLRSPVLEEAEHWIASRPAGGPLPTQEAQALVEESRKAATQRQRLAVVATLAAAIGAGGLALWAEVNRWEAGRQRDLAVANEQRAQRERDQALLTQSRFLSDLARQSSGQGDHATAMLLALEALPDAGAGATRPYAPDAERHLFAARQKLAEEKLTTFTGDLPPRVLLSRDGRRAITIADKAAQVWDADARRMIASIECAAPLRQVSFSPDGQLVLVTEEKDHRARLFDAQSGKAAMVLEGHTAAIETAAFSPDGTRVVTAARDRTARVWDSASGQTVVLLKGVSGAGATFSPDGRLVLAGAEDGAAARIFDVATGRAVRTLNGAHPHGVFSPDGRRILAWSGENNAPQVFDAASGRLLATLSGHEAAIRTGHINYLNDVAFSPDSRLVVTLARDGTARVWDVATAKTLTIVNDVSGFFAIFSPDSRTVLTAFADKSVRLWEAETGKTVVALRGHGDLVESGALSADGRRVVTAAFDHTVRIWELDPSGMVAVLRGHDDRVWRVAFSPDGRRVVTASWDKTVRIWDVETGSAVRVLEGHTDVVQSASFSPDGRRIVTSSSLDHTVRIWDVETGASLAVLNEDAWRVDFSPDGRRLVAVGDGVRVWDIGTGKVLTTIAPHGDDFRGAAFSADGRLLVTAFGESVRVWTAQTGAAVSTIGQPADAVAFSRDGRLVATVMDNQVRYWDVATGAQVVPAPGHMVGLFGAIFSPDGGRIVRPVETSTHVQVIDLATRQAVADLTGHDLTVQAAVFSVDGRRAATSSWDRTARVYRVFPTMQALIEEARQSVWRCLTREQRTAAFLGPEPPAWCIAMEKWPFHTPAWKAWLRFSHAGLDPPLPDTPEWDRWRAARQADAPAPQAK